MNWKKPARPFGPALHGGILRVVLLVVGERWDVLFKNTTWDDLVRRGYISPRALVWILGRDVSSEERALIDQNIRSRIAWHVRRER